MLPTHRPPETHVSIDTTDLAASTAFYRALLGVEPALERPDYVRFWPTEPALVLGLNLRNAPAPRPDGTGPLQHLGLLYPDSAALRGARARLHAAGHRTEGAEHTTCCYAELDQFWATDPSGVRWELFQAHTVELATRDSRGAEAPACCAPECCP